MIYLLLAILTSAAIPIIFKYAHRKALNEAVVITMNYLTISVLTGTLLVIKGTFLDWSDPLKVRAAIFGLVSGVFFYVGFYLYQRSVRACGATLAGAFGKIGILIPATLSLILWRESPSLVQWLGIVIAIVAILVTVINFKDMKVEAVHGILLIFFFIGGLGDFSTKVFEVYNAIEYTELFLFMNFLSAMIWSLPGALRQHERNRQNLYAGMMVGLPNLMTSYFLVYAMTKVSAVIVFPIFSGGTVVTVSLLSSLLFKEKLKQKEYLAITMIVLALILIQ